MWRTSGLYRKRLSFALRAKIMNVSQNLLRKKLMLLHNNRNILGMELCVERAAKGNCNLHIFVKVKNMFFPWTSDGGRGLFPCILKFDFLLLTFCSKFS